MIKDALNFFRLRTQDIEHYDRYRISSILLVLVFILLWLRTLVGYAQNCQIDSFTCIFSLSSNDQITIAEMDEIFGIFSYNLVSSVGILLAYLFFTYWVFRKVKKHPFILLYKFFGIMAIGIIIGIYSTIFIPLLMSILADHLYYSYEIHILGSTIDILINYPLYFFSILPKLHSERNKNVTLADFLISCSLLTFDDFSIISNIYWNILSQKSENIKHFFEYSWIVIFRP